MNVRSFLESRGHAAALGSSAVLFVAVAASAALGHDAQRDAISLRASTAAASVLSNPAPVLEKPDYSAISLAWSPAAVTSPEGKREFVSAPKTRVVAHVIGAKRVEPGPGRDLPAAPVPEASATPSRVSLRWAPVAKGDAVATVSEIRVLRKGQGDKAAVVVATLRADAIAWEDADVKPRSVYEYRLVVATAQATKNGRQESEPSLAALATSPAEAEVRFVAGSDGNAAIIIVRKWIDGEWLEHSFTTFPKNEESGRDGAFGGFAMREGKRVDFSCGFTLLAVRRESRRFTVPFQETKIVNGMLRVRQFRKEMSRECLRIGFTDDTGARRALWKEGDLPEGAEPLTENDKQAK